MSSGEAGWNMVRSEIKLTLPEMEIAKTIGCLRRFESMRQNLKRKHGYEEAAVWDVDIEGAAAELAYSKFRGMYWGGCVNNYKQADVGKNVQVRSTKLKSGSLIIRENDEDDHFYVLVVGKIPNFEIKGWILGKDGKQDKWKKAPNGRVASYFVPQEALNRFSG